MPGSDVYLFLLTPACRASTDQLGRFLIRGVPAGTTPVITNMAGYRPFKAVHVTVSAGDTTTVELRLVPGSALDDCRALPPCAVLLERGSAAEDIDDIGFRAVALGTAIGLTWKAVTAEARWVACIDEEPKAVVDILSDRYGAAADAEGCTFGPDPLRPGHSRLLHVDTNRPAFRVFIEFLEVLTPARRTVGLGYLDGSGGGHGWECDFERTARGWRATLCQPTWEA